MLPHTILLTGFMTGMSLIIPIGAQNAFVLKQGLLKQHVLIVTLLCGLMDAVLIALGTFLAQTAQGLGMPEHALFWVKVFGVGFLILYGARSFWTALHHTRPNASPPLQQSVDARSAIVTCLGFTLLNPHVYLDTVLLLGSLSSHYGARAYLFALGAASASVLWFLSLGYGARLLTPFFSHPKAWVFLELFIGTIMWTIAYQIWHTPLHTL